MVESNHSSSPSAGNLTIPAVAGNTSTVSSPDLTAPSSSDPSADATHGSNHDRASDPSAIQTVNTPDNDGIEPATLSGVYIATAAVVVVALIVFLVRRRSKRSALFVPTPSLILHLHTEMESPASDSDRPPTFRPFSKHRESAATTLTDASARSSAAARRFSKASSTSSNADSVLPTSVCVDPVITAARIPLAQVHVRDVVGRGGFSEVYRGSYDGRAVAVKKLLPDRRHDLVHIETFLSEVKFHSTLEHPYVVRFIGVAWDSLSELCIVSELMDGGDLRSLLHKFERVEHRPKGFDKDKTRIALHVIHAVAYLHSLAPAVLHRDLKSRNILLDRQLNAKLADFGVARERVEGTMTSGVGSSLWMAPEVMVGGRYGDKADVYSFGVVLSELDTHLSPYAHAREPRDGRRKIPEVTVLQMVAMGKLQVEFSASKNAESRAMVELATRCVAREPSDRPTAAQVMHSIHLIYRNVQ